MKFKAQIRPASHDRLREISLIGENGDEYCELLAAGGDGALTREEFERLQDALVSLINREGLEVSS